MSVRERVVSIQIIEKIQRNPEYADEIGLKGEMHNIKYATKTKADIEKLIGLAANKRIVMSAEEG